MLDFPCGNLKELIEKKAAENGNKSYCLYEDRVITYEKVHQDSNIIAHNLRKLGVKKGDPVLVFLYNSPEYIMIWFALAKLGAVMVPINTALRRNDLTHIIEDSEARTIVIESELLDGYKELRDRGGIEREILIRTKPSDDLEHMIPFENLLKEGSSDDLDTEINVSDPMCIMYTSGTTGKSKGVVLPHFCYVNSGREMARYARLKPGDRMLTALPLFHIGAQLVVALSAMIANIDFALIKRFSASKFWDQARKYNCNVVHCIITLAHILYRQKEKPDDADNPAERALGGGMAEAIWEKFEHRFGVTYLAFYGLTETGCLCTYTPRTNKIKVGSIGLPVPYQRVEIVNDNDEILPPYAHGEIVIRPELPYSMMLRYHKNPEATLEAWRNLWFHTGDIAYRDEEGYFFFVGRRNYFIRCRGENVSAEEVEGVINTYQKVKESAVVGVPGEIGDEDIKAFVVPKEGPITPEEIVHWCEERLAYFKIPRYIEFLDELPLTAEVNRVERYKLKERGIGNAWDRESAGYKIKRK